MTENGWIDERTFFQGFALVQAMPGPVFNVSAFLGAVAWCVTCLEPANVKDERFHL
jgi:chromate transport protein ChrA